MSLFDGAPRPRRRPRPTNCKGAAANIGRTLAYLGAYPTGVFAPEAAYNRALCLARLGRFVEASAALRPFARGHFGPYRRHDATVLLDWLAAR